MQIPDITSEPAPSRSRTRRRRQIQKNPLEFPAQQRDNFALKYNERISSRIKKPLLCAE